MSKKEVNEVLNDVQETVEETVDQVQEEVTEVVTKEEGKVKKAIKKNWKRVAIDLTLFAAGYGTKMLLDVLFKGSIDIPTSNVTDNVIDMPTPEVKVDTAI